MLNLNFLRFRSERIVFIFISVIAEDNDDKDDNCCLLVVTCTIDVDEVHVILLDGWFISNLLFVLTKDLL